MMNAIYVTREDILGSWRLIRTYETIDGRESSRLPLGAGAYGIIHYLPDNRMYVMMANGGRARMSSGRYTSGVEETADSAKSFTAYAGLYTVKDDVIAHHLDICLYENDTGTYYIRIPVLVGNRLTLKMPPHPTEKGVVQWCLEWEKMGPGELLP